MLPRRFLIPAIRRIRWLGREVLPTIFDDDGGQTMKLAGVLAAMLPSAIGGAAVGATRFGAASIDPIALGALRFVIAHASGHFGDSQPRDGGARRRLGTWSRRSPAIYCSA
jgi:hypothetical protein